MPNQVFRGVPDRQLDAVIFDFHGTLATTQPPVTWVGAALVQLGAALDPGRLTVLADRYATAGGLPGVAQRDARIPVHLAEVWADRDLSAYAHRAAYVGLCDTVDSGVDGLSEAIYERVLTPEGWVVYADAVPTIRALREAGVAVGVLSNIGFDIRPHLSAWGIGDVPATLSYEVGLIKPDPKIFLRACAALGAEPERTLMIGDTPADAGAVHAGLRTLVLPAAEPGQANGLSAALNLAVPH
ncbi:HAD-IA family hydrolase [Hamadaea sp.]|uniref:HAD family hydrolase n=1 Tax=Hamadaea sp. TaxID=2024425 RepID=UPI0025C3B022|nr:HAD-IA family hydrolase [Hamadaea sp.]